MAIKSIEIILLIIVIIMLLPLRMAVMKILTEIFLIILTLALINQNLGPSAVFLCLAMIGNLFLVKSVVCRDEEMIIYGGERSWLNFACAGLLGVLLLAFSYYCCQDVLFPLKKTSNPLNAGTVGIFVVVFILVNLNKKESNR